MINIKVLKDCAEVSYEIPGRKKQIKVIGISDIPGLFDSKILFDSGMLPVFGTENSYGIQRIIQKDNQMIVFVQGINPFVNMLHTECSDLDENARELLGIGSIKTAFSEYTKKHEEGATCYKNVYLPNLLMSVQLKKDSKDCWKVHNTGLLCYKDHFISDQTQLYKFPFSNIYRGSTYGSICWGSENPVASSAGQAVALIHSFLGAIMNTHLFDPIKIKGYEIQCSSELLAYLSLRSEDINCFPYEDINLSKVIKYNDLISYLNQNWK